MRDHDEHPEKAAALLERREVLGLLGAGGVLLAAPRFAEAAAEAAPIGPCPGMPGCPPAMPTVPAKPPTDKLPGLMKLATTLAQNSAEGRKLRHGFNACPDKFLGFYNLSEADLANFLEFNPNRTLIYVGEKFEPIKDHKAEWDQLLDAAASVKSFWDGWPTWQPKDCYDDPQEWCTGEYVEQYSHPSTRIYEVLTTTVGGTTTVTVRAQGVVTPFVMEVLPVAGGAVTEKKKFERDNASTFRCAAVVGEFILETGKTYFVRMTIAQQVVRESDPFSI